ncbi:Fe-S cluster assembly protein SufD [Kamptonema formosum]|uniref:Fe-S cluster assembly protein SufD n=1 Tax=Kamptonema formosum TaxID=331992 RepID=UPI0003483118|nr:Fe-S cluster assembly protein SufD [Oscillatoria sp. PCC 10802]
MSSQVANRDAYLAELVEQCRKLGKGKRESCAYGLKDLRDAAAEFVLASGFPTTRDEEWRFTDLSELKQIPFQVAGSAEGANLGLSDITLPVREKDALPLRVVFVNGYYAPHLSAADASLLPTLALELFVGNLSNAPGPYHARIRECLSERKQRSEVFEALNVAALVDAAVVVVPKNQEIETPVHLLFLAVPGEAPAMCAPHCLVIAEPGSKVTVIEDYAAVGRGVSFTNAVTEIVVGENARVDHIRIQRESAEAFHIGKSSVEQARNSRYSCYAVSLGAKLSRHNLDVRQAGEGTETALNGLVAVAGEQLADTHSTIALNYPHGRSRQLHKCVVGDRARGVFSGKVIVAKAAQLTDAAQLSRNLLLSAKARVDTKPQLEIVADNVKCSHGATVSQLDAEEVFYLQSRGLDGDAARTLLIDAFVGEVLNQLPVLSLRQTLASAASRLKAAS